MGTVSAAGVYTAPNVAPTGTNTVTVTAVSQFDSSKSGSATLSVINPEPTLSSIYPSSALAGSSDTTVAVVGTGFTPSSVVNFNSQPLVTQFLSSSSLSAVIPSGQLSSSGTAQVSLATPTPGGGTSSAAQFTINPVTASNSIVILASPVYGGSSSGPWQVSASAIDANGNPIPYLPITLSLSEGTLTSNGSATDSNGALSATLAPPVSYAGEAVTVTAAAGGQSAVVNIVFDAASAALQQQAAALVSHGNLRYSGPLPRALPQASGTNTNSPTVQQAIIGTSSATNPFLSDATDQVSALCHSTAQLGSTIPLNCQTLNSTKQIESTPLSSAASLCDTSNNILGIGSCVGAGLVAVSCASPETIGGAAICTGFVSTGTEASMASSCVGYVAGLVAKAMAGSNRFKDAEGKVLITDIGLLSGEGGIANPYGDASDLVGVECNAVDVANLAYGPISVSPNTATLSLGQTQTFSTANGASVNWSVMDGSHDNLFGTFNPVTGPVTIYTAPSSYPEFCGFVTGFCGITVSATKPTDAGVQTLTVVSLVNGTSIPSPTNLSLAPAQVSVGLAGMPTTSSNGVTGIELAINGSGFLGSSSVTVNGTPKIPTYIDPKQLKIFLTTTDAASVGQLTIVVSNDSGPG